MKHRITNMSCFEWLFVVFADWSRDRPKIKLIERVDLVSSSTKAARLLRERLNTIDGQSIAGCLADSCSPREHRSDGARESSVRAAGATCLRQDDEDARNLVERVEHGR